MQFNSFKNLRELFSRLEFILFTFKFKNLTVGSLFCFPLFPLLSGNNFPFPAINPLVNIDVCLLSCFYPSTDVRIFSFNPEIPFNASLSS